MCRKNGGHVRDGAIILVGVRPHQHVAHCLQALSLARAVCTTNQARSRYRARVSRSPMMQTYAEQHRATEWCEQWTIIGGEDERERVAPATVAAGVGGEAATAEAAAAAAPPAAVGKLAGGGGANSVMSSYIMHSTRSSVEAHGAARVGSAAAGASRSVSALAAWARDRARRMNEGSHVSGCS